MWRPVVFLLFCVAVSADSGAEGQDKIKNFVVVMLENNSMDRIFGRSKLIRKGRLTGKEFNRDVLGRKVPVGSATKLAKMCNPDHSVEATTMKLFGFPVPDFRNASMSGFIAWEEVMRHHDDGCNTLHVFNESDLPVHNFLAAEGALFDYNFASVPGPTWPNRWFTLMGTSGGLTDTGDWSDFQTGRLFKGRTIFDQCHDANLTWRYYYPTTPWELCLSSVLHNPQNLFHFDQFLQDAKEGTLPSFSWINPRSGADALTGVGSNDAHPSHDMALAEAFLKDIYEAVRASPQYNSTALIVMYDEHGGFWDGVSPPMEGVPPPDSHAGIPVPFKFDRLGVRVPLIVLSPWIPRGTVVSEPPEAQKPFPTSQYDHTSVMATFRKVLGFTEGPLTKRDAWSGTFEHIFSLDEPRTDAPMRAPPPPPPSLPNEAQMPLTDLQREIFEMHAAVSRANYRQVPRLQGQLHASLLRHFQHAVSKVRAADSLYKLQIEAEPGQAFLRPKSIKDDTWNMRNNRIASGKLAFQGTPFCWTQGDDGSVEVQLCRNASTAQHFTLESGGSIRNAAGQCVTAVRHNDQSDDFFGTYGLTVSECNEGLMQSFTYYWNGAVGAEGETNNLMLGDGQGAFVITE